MMRRYFFLLIAIISLISTTALAQKKGYEITTNIKGVQPDSMLLLANYFGEHQYIKDSAYVNKDGVAVFSGDDTLTGGLYLIVFPDKNYFEVIISDDQHFSIEGDRKDIMNSMKFQGSEENEVFYGDMRLLNNKRIEYEKTKERLDRNRDNADSVAVLEAQLKAIDQDVRTARNKIKESGSFYGKFLTALEDPHVPDPPKNEDGSIDSMWQFYYYKAHYFDNFDFSDVRMLYTPAFHQKVNNYLTKLTVQQPDSLMAAADYLIDESRANNEVFKYSLAWLLNKYAASKIMGMDAVYVHLVEKYYMTGEADWVAEDQLEKMIKDARDISAVMLGNKAPNITMRDRNGKQHTLYDINKPYTILYFWDADCGHCRKITPEWHKLYQATNDSVEVYAVSVEEIDNHWKTYIEEHKLSWINVIDINGESNFRRYYPIRATPTVFLLDKDKKIIAKRLDPVNMTKLLEDLMDTEIDVEFDIEEGPEH